MGQTSKICKNWRELNTPFGKLYIEPWEWHSDNLFPYDRNDRITIYDSRGDWFDYFPVDYFYDGYFEEGMAGGEEEILAQNAYEALCDMLEIGAQETTLQGFLNWLGISFHYAGPDKKEAVLELFNGYSEELLEELDANDYVNHIGDNYIVIAEC